MHKLEEKVKEAYLFQEYYAQWVNQAALHIQARLLHGKKQPLFGIVLGSGLGDLAEAISSKESISYAEIQNFPQPTVAQHAGILHYGQLEGVPVLALQGRKHYYEVADLPFNNGMLQVVFPVHVLANLGVTHYFATNAAGGLNSRFEVGTVMAISSHLNGGIPNPLLGRQYKFKRVDTGEDAWRFQPMNNAYDRELRLLLFKACEEAVRNEEDRPLGVSKASIGTYLAVTGPSYETEAECIAFRQSLQVDAVGMSTVPETIVARNRGMKVVGMSCITNIIASDGTNATNHEEVTAVLNSRKIRERLTNSVLGFFRSFKEKYI